MGKLRQPSSWKDVRKFYKGRIDCEPTKARIRKLLHAMEESGAPWPQHCEMGSEEPHMVWSMWLSEQKVTTFHVFCGPDSYALMGATADEGEEPQQTELGEKQKARHVVDALSAWALMAVQAHDVINGSSFMDELSTA